MGNTGGEEEDIGGKGGGGGGGGGGRQFWQTVEGVEAKDCNDGQPRMLKEEGGGGGGGVVSIEDPLPKLGSAE